MLTNIYARTIMNATLHKDLPNRPLTNRPLPGAYRPPERHPGGLSRWLKRVTGAR